MLVLKRTLAQQIVIADSIRIIVLKVRGNYVTLGIEAPPSASILRGELVEKQATLFVRTEETLSSSSCEN